MAEPAAPAEPDAASVARALLEAGAVSVRPDDPITLTSGLRSPVYVDNRRLIYHPGAWHTVIGALLARLRSGTIEADVVAGVESGGIPHSSALAYAARRPSVFVRKGAREHGQGRRIEGGDVAGRRVLLIEDMVTTGSSSLSAIEVLRSAGAAVRDCLAIVTYGFAATSAAFQGAGVQLGVLTTFEDVLDEAVASGRIGSGAATVVRTWLADPGAWGRA